MGRNESHSARYSTITLFHARSTSLSFSLFTALIIIEKIFIFPLYLALASAAVGEGGWRESDDLIADTIIMLLL